MNYKIFLDDIRFPNWIYSGTNNGDWVILRSYDEFIKWVESHDFSHVEFMSFDNDLSEDKTNNPLPEGVDVVKWMVFEKELDISNMDFNVHSANTARWDYIAGTLNNWKKELQRRKEENLEERFIRTQIKNILEESFLREQEQRFKFPIKIPQEILDVKDIFVQNNYKLFLVGGSVRDSLLGKQPKDYDLVTDAVPDKVIEILKNKYKVLETGKVFGVINVVLPSGDQVEIATMRQDIGKGRRPDSVKFTDITTDSRRRDLTLNALYYDIDNQEVIDLVGGVEDLKKGIVRTVGVPEERFDEDKLRKLRVIRFSARLGSDLDPATSAALLKDNNLERISLERIRDEFLKGISSAKSVVYFLQLLQKYRFFDWIFPGLILKEGGMQSLDFVEERDYIVLLAYMLQDNDINKLKTELHKLTYTIDEVKAIVYLVSFRKLTPDNAYVFKKNQANSRVAPNQIKRFAELNKMDMHLVNTFLKFELSVSGDELMKQGFKGPDIGKEMERLEIENFKKLLG